MRDVIVFALVFGMLPFAFLRPFHGLLLFSWLAYMRAPDLTWGAAKTFRFSMIVAVTMYAGWFLFDRRKFMLNDRRNWYMMLLTAAVGVSYILAPYKIDSVDSKAFEFVKVISIALFTTGQLDSKSRLRTMVWLVALSLGFYGIKGGVWYAITQDARIIRGPGGLLLDNNDFSLAMVMNIPFLFYLARAESNRRVKTFLRVAVFLTVITIMMTTSRGGFLAMAAVFGVLVLKSNYKMVAIPAAMLAAVLFFLMIPKDYKERLASIRTAAKTDSSAIGRLKAWAVAWEMVKWHPFFGVGFANFTFFYRQFDPSEEGSPTRVAHNSYLQLWAESGSFAFGFFLATIFSSILFMRRIQRVNRVRDGPHWVSDYASMIEVTLYGFLVGAMFLNRAHFDFLYQTVALGVALAPIAVREMSAAASRERGPRRGGELVIRSTNPYLVGGYGS